MNRALAAEVVDCLSVAGSSRERLQPLTRFSRRDWQAILDWLNLSGIALVFWDRLQKLGAEDAVPRQVGAALATNLAHHRLRVAAMTQEFDSLNHQFERAGIEYAAWKGFALIPEYSPDACLRPTYDYDYLISRDAWDCAQNVLQAAGYAGKTEHGGQPHLTFALRNLSSPLPYLPGGLYAATLPRKVELRLNPWDEEAFGICLGVPERPLDRRVRRTWHGLRFYSLGEEDAFVFQALHTFQHILHDWCRLGWILEIAHFLQSRSTDSSFWKRLYAHLEGNEPLTEVVALVILLAARVFHAALPALLNDQILGAMRGQMAIWVERYGLRSALDNFSDNKYALFLYREYVRDEAVWRQIRRARLLPLHRPNRVAGAAASATSVLLPASWKQGWYIVQRLIHHSVRGADYAWESARWDRLRRRSADRDRPSG
ncbi:MAG: nucleotidyltransferase family protein [Terriglobia bacterium]|jgi:hypothetical protein